MRHRRLAPILAVALLLLASCWWLESEPGPGEWRHRSGTIGDFQPHHVATLYEADALGRLQMECGQGPIGFSVAPDRELVDSDEPIRLPVRYRLDGNPPVAASAWSNGHYLWFRDPQRASGDDPMVRQIAGARQLTLRIDWSPTDRQIMRFDTSRAGPTIEWLRRECAESRARHA